MSEAPWWDYHPTSAPQYVPKVWLAKVGRIRSIEHPEFTMPNHEEQQ